MNVKSMIAEIQCYIHIMTGKNEVPFSVNLQNPKEVFALKSAWHTATRYFQANNIRPRLLGPGEI